MELIKDLLRRQTTEFANAAGYFCQPNYFELLNALICSYSDFADENCYDLPTELV